MTKTKNVTNEPNFKTSRPKGIRTFALSPLPFAMVSPNEPNYRSPSVPADPERLKHAFFSQKVGFSGGGIIIGQKKTVIVRELKFL